MPYEIQQCSPRVERLIESRVDLIGCDTEKSGPGRYSIYPFNQLRIGQCFIIQFDFIKSNNVRSMASYHSKGGKRFTVIKHTEHACYEVARIA